MPDEKTLNAFVGTVVGGYVSYDPATRRYELPAEHAMVLADENSPALMLGCFDFAATFFADEDLILDAFRAGHGWAGTSTTLGCTRAASGSSVRCTTAAWCSPGFPRWTAWRTSSRRVPEWPTSAAGTAAPPWCWPRRSRVSTFVGYDYHDASIATARKAAAPGRPRRPVRFEVAAALDLPGSYDLVCFFDCLHDMGDPVGAASHVRDALAPNGTWLLVEPMAGDRLADNLNPVGRLYYAGSVMLCTPSSLAQEVGLGLGNQVGEKRLAELLTEAGFGHVRRATETPFNLILEVWP